MLHVLVVGVVDSQAGVASLRVGEGAMDQPLRPLVPHRHGVLTVEGDRDFLASFAVDLTSLRNARKR